jgi:hypothetical protein
VLDTYVKFFQAHEKVIISVVLALALFGGIERIDNLVVKHDKATQTTQALVVNADIAKNAAVAQQIIADNATMKQMQAASDAKQAALQAQVVDLLARLVAQQKQDAIMTPTELTDRWDVLVPAAGASISNGQVTLPEAGAVATVQQLEQVPVQKQELDAAHQQFALEDGLLVQSQKTNADLETQITGLKTTAIDAAKKCEADKSVIKAEARKSKFHWFIGGAVTVLVTLAKFGAL